MEISSASSMLNIDMETSWVNASSSSRSNSQQIEWALIEALSTIPSRSPPSSFSTGSSTTPQCLFPSLDTVMEAGVPCCGNNTTTNIESRASPARKPLAAFPAPTVVPPASRTSSGNHASLSFDGLSEPEFKKVAETEQSHQGSSIKSAASDGLGANRHQQSGGMLGNMGSTGSHTNTITGILPSFRNVQCRSRASESKWQCQAEGCGADIPRGAKLLDRRHKICDSCTKSDSLIVKGDEVRFCQQCSSLHPLSEFDGYKRSCRRMLKKHLLFVRRRRAARKAAVGGSRIKE